MKAIRTSIYPHWRQRKAPVTTYVTEKSITVSPGEYSLKLLGAAAECLVVVDVFDVPDGAEMTKVMLEGIKRLKARAETEQHMNTFFGYVTDLFERFPPGAVMPQSRPSPLSPTDVRSVLHRICRHPNYRDQRLLAIAENGEVFVARDGVVARFTRELPAGSVEEAREAIDLAIRSASS